MSDPGGWDPREFPHQPVPPPSSPVGGYYPPGPWQSPGQPPWQSPGQPPWQRPGHPGWYLQSPVIASRPAAGKAVAALILSLVSVFPVPVLPGVAAVILAIVAHAEIRRSGGQLRGEGMCLAALIISVLAAAAWTALFIALAIAATRPSNLGSYTLTL